MNELGYMTILLAVLFAVSGVAFYSTHAGTSAKKRFTWALWLNGLATFFGLFYLAADRNQAAMNIGSIGFFLAILGFVSLVTGGIEWAFSKPTYHSDNSPADAIPIESQTRVMATHVLQTKFWYFVVAIVAVGILALIAVEVAGRPRELKLRVAGMHCEGCVSNVTEALKKVEGVRDAQVKFLDTPASLATDATKPAVEEKKLGTATVTVAGLHTPSEKELQDAVHDLAGENFEVTLE